MTNSQKTMILLFLIIFSFILHITFCEWSSPREYSWAAQPIFGDQGDRDTISLYADKIIYKKNVIAIIIGIFIPIILIGFALYLYLGWKLEVDDVVNKIYLKINSQNSHNTKIQSNTNEDNDLPS